MIARNYDGVSIQDIQDANPSINSNLISVGSEVNLLTIGKREAQYGSCFLPFALYTKIV